jgi:hypothetical protein
VPPGFSSERFWANVSPEPNTGCWLWAGGMDDKGYGRFSVDGVAMHAHRLAWIEIHGPIPAGLNVCHKCDTPACVNAETHHFLGTQAENVADMIAKGRQGRGARKLSDEQVLEIRARWGSGELSKPELGRIYGVHWTTIGRVVRGEAYRRAA